MGSVVAVVIALGLGLGIVYLSPQITPSSTTQYSVTQSSLTESTVSESTSVVASVTAACTAPGVQCGGMKILSESLMAPATLNATSYSILNIALMNNSTGGLVIKSVQIYLNDILVGEIKGPIEVGQNATSSFSIPSSTIQVSKGAAYTLGIDSEAGGILTNITAH